MSWDDPNDDSIDDPRKALRKWFGDFLPESMFQQVEEMMKRMMEQIGQDGTFDPEALQKFMKESDGANPFVFGFQMRVGPDGKPIIQRFGNTPDKQGFRPTPEIEPLVDVIEENDEIIVVAELPGVEKEEIKVHIKGKNLTIRVENPQRPYRKTVELPTKVKKDQAKSSIRNGILEVRLKVA